MLVVDFNELRSWLLFIIAVISICITIRTFRESTKQRRIDNTYKTLEFLRRHIGKKEINKFIDLFHANNELTGVKFNEFRFEDGRIDTIENMFSEGGCGNGEIQNMIELFNLISPTLDKLEIKIIWYEYGQIMMKIYGWTKYLQNIEPTERGAYFYADFNNYMDKNLQKMIFDPTKIYVYAE